MKETVLHDDIVEHQIDIRNRKSGNTGSVRDAGLSEDPAEVVRKDKVRVREGIESVQILPEAPFDVLRTFFQNLIAVFFIGPAFEVFKRDRAVLRITAVDPEIAVRE